MQGQFKFFKKLPDNLKIEITQSLSLSTLVKFALTAKNHLVLFKPIIDASRLLQSLVRGEHDEVHLMLYDNINLIFQKGKVTDCSGRTFDNISAFEYTLWALDKHMWAMMLNCIPKYEVGKNICAILLTQYDQVNTVGITYRLNGKIITEKHFDYENTIIKELQTQLDLLDIPGKKNWDIINKQWVEGVGGAQKLLPMHVVNEYGSRYPFYPLPDFIRHPASIHFGNSKTREENWFGPDSKIGLELAVYKGRWDKASWSKSTCNSIVKHDLAALRALFKLRIQDLINLKSKLKKQMDICHDSQFPSFLYPDYIKISKP
ncbi:F-box protein [Legionella gresilensis]|uniref:F-box protein n=1 Tax=Legionella gresilensis TaxID=91823 RepID=UPI001F5F7919|nr:F-box protein [Legionella gresilensis]